MKKKSVPKKKSPSKREVKLSEAEAEAILAAASKIYEPTSLLQKWELRRDPLPAIGRFVHDLRRFGNDPILDDPTAGPEYVARIMEGLVKRFELLVVAGALDEALPKLSGLPLLYSPRAGTGAADWKGAFDLYAAKSVGANGPLEHRGAFGGFLEKPPWQELAADAVWVVQAAAELLPTLQEQRDRGHLAFHYEMGRTPGKKKSHGWVFSLPGRELLWWPDWLEACKGVAALANGGAHSVPVADAREPYLVAVRAVLDDFFAVPLSAPAAAIVKRVTGVREGLHYSSAVAEARKHVLDAVKRM